MFDCQIPASTGKISKQTAHLIKSYYLTQAIEPKFFHLRFYFKSADISNPQ